jgi:hypothetical protein
MQTKDSDSLATAAELTAAWRSPSDAAAFERLLTPNAQFATLGRSAAGAGPVAAELAQGPTGEFARRLDWQAPEIVRGQVRLTGRPRPGTADRGMVLTLGFEGLAIAVVQQQRLPGAPTPARPLVLPEALRHMIGRALVERHPMMLAYTGPNDQPILSFRGSVQVDGDDRLAMWIRNADGVFVRSIRQRPKVALVYRNEDTKATYNFQGRAHVSDSPADRQRVFDASPEVERAHDFAMLGVPVLVDLDRVEGYAGLGPAGQIDGIRLMREPSNP